MMNVQDANPYQLGSITYFYESGKRNIYEAVGVISSGFNDPGGKSYGIYQLASKTDTLKNFIGFFKIKTAHYFDNTLTGYFDTVVIASIEFDEKWRWLAKQFPIAFANIQHDFIAATHYDPLIKFFTDRNISADTISPALKEALWSLGVQHGKALMILENCYAEFNNVLDERSFIETLYKHRTKYVHHLTTLNETMKINICKRYEKECAEIIAMLINNRQN